MLRVIVLLALVHLNSADWHCGGYRVDNFLSKVVCYPSSYSDDINSCCRVHDADYDKLEAAGAECGFFNFFCRTQRVTSDAKFCGCLRQIPSVYVQLVIAPTFCGIVNVFSIFKNFF